VDYTALNDDTLIRLIVRADADALSELYDRYNRLVFSLAVATVGDRATAEEIVLDVFTRVWEKAATYRGEQARVSSWLSSITRYRAIDELRRRGARPQLESLDLADVAARTLRRANGPETAIELRLQRQRVRAALTELPEEQKQVLVLAYFQGYTHREIAEALDQPLGTVKTRIRLGMQKLRAMLHEEQVGV
jgi:RNA polymerase sigma-70 factor (ECF subfamily)